ncbi:hypothetical protein BS47DRAFT_1356869 [Hydnum rufescens UP504]|uniref:Uncharacterized protein n=1 Tax=Hydnum rufescens UP504 TaxID=1448309 RepID=A0A9P6DLM7_9AGAM|nr:hypothetical protein BS47DRAFT_1356869 [Hydnum rufescens UP504]
MKLAHSLALLVTAALTLPSALADFHIAGRIDAGGNINVVVCPSNKYTCDCFEFGHGSAEISGLENTASDFFITKGGFCKMGRLNFYKRDGCWKFYENNGDGKVKGTCDSEPNPATLTCNGLVPLNFVDQLFCKSRICEE